MKHEENVQQQVAWRKQIRNVEARELTVFSQEEFTEIAKDANPANATTDCFTYPEAEKIEYTKAAIN